MTALLYTRKARQAAVYCDCIAAWEHNLCQEMQSGLLRGVTGSKVLHVTAYAGMITVIT